MMNQKKMRVEKVVDSVALAKCELMYYDNLVHLDSDCSCYLSILA